MQVLLGALLGVFIWVGAVGGPAPAGAISITIGAIADPTPDLCLSTSAPTACNGGGASAGSVELTIAFADLLAGDIIASAELHITLWDDFGKADGNEKIDVFVDGLGVLYNADANHDAVVALSDFSLFADGEAKVLVVARDGDFFLGGASLSLSVERPESPAGGEPSSVEGVGPDGRVSAPVPLLLLGLGTAVLGWARYRSPQGRASSR